MHTSKIHKKMPKENYLQDMNDDKVNHWVQSADLDDTFCLACQAVEYADIAVLVMLTDCLVRSTLFLTASQTIQMNPIHPTAQRCENICRSNYRDCQNKKRKKCNLPIEKP